MSGEAFSASRVPYFTPTPSSVLRVYPPPPTPQVIKGGTIAWAQMGDPNASIPTPQPVIMRPMFGAYGKAVGPTSLAFVSREAAEAGVGDAYGLEKEVSAVRKCRDLTKADMVLNDATPDMEVDPETFRVYADGEHLTCQPVDVVPLAQRFFLF